MTTKQDTTPEKSVVLADAPVAPVEHDQSNDELVSKLNRLTPEQFQQVLLFVEELSGNDLEP